MLRTLYSSILKGFVGLIIFYAHVLMAQNDLDPWYKNSIIYSLELGTFQDSDGDGIGDFKGLTQRLDYLDSLGVDVIWLAPFMPSPGHDDGYDVADHYKINPKYGTPQDFEAFMKAAKSKKMRIIMDVVLNHTSIEHQWYQQARKDSTSPYHNWYVWSKHKPKDADKGMVFPGVQKETWTYDSLAGKYYFHRFYNFQPDLNFTVPAVQQQAYDILKYWLRKGVDGYRLDAVPFIIDIPETSSDQPDRMLELIPELRNAVKSVKEDAVLLGEANLAPKENKDYFGKDNNGMQMMFNFYANQYLFYALATGKLKLFKRAIEDTKEKPDVAQWAYFMRNHDEVDLERLGTRRRKKVYEKFGPDPNMQLYDRGIRRRLAPMLNNEAQLRMAYSLLFSLPGTPVIRYGEEIGMGDDLSLKERLSVRTPMQWSSASQAGFTSSDRPFRKIIADSSYGYQKVNVALQSKDSASLLNFVRHLIKLRKQCPEIGTGKFEILETTNKNIFALEYKLQGKRLVVIHNFSDKEEEFSLGKDWKDLKFNNLMSPQFQANNPKSALPKMLPAYGFAWYRVK